MNIFVAFPVNYNNIHNILRGGIMQKPIKISVKGEDGYKVISMRVKEKTLEQVDNYAKLTNRSRNEILNMLLDSAIENVEIDYPEH